VCLADYSVPMIKRAQHRLAPSSDRVQHPGVRSAGFGLVGGPCDAVASALAIHNRGEPAAIRRVFTNVAGLLGPGELL
jgi:hypothetical protein